MYYSPSDKAYRLFQDGMVNSYALTATSSYEPVTTPITLTHKVEESWAHEALVALTDRSASFPEVVVKWKWIRDPAVTQELARVVVEMQSDGPQPNPDYVTVSWASLRTGQIVSPTELVKTWRHVDSDQTKVAVLVSATVGLVPGVTDAGVLLRLLDVTPFTGYRTLMWSVSVELESARLEVMGGADVKRLMDCNDFLQTQDMVEIGYPASRLNSIASSDSWPDLATLARAMVDDNLECDGAVEAPAPTGTAR